MIIVAANTRGRTPTRGKSNARPLSSGMEIINFTRHAGRWTSILRDLSGISFARVRGVVAGMQHPGHRTSFLFSGLSRFQACKQSSRGVCQAFQELILSAQAMSLAAGVYGQHIGRREMKCPTKALKDPTK